MTDPRQVEREAAKDAEVARLRALYKQEQARSEEALSAERDLRTEIEQLRAQRDRWETVSAGALKEQFRLAAERDRWQSCHAMCAVGFERLTEEKAKLEDEIEQLRIERDLWKQRVNEAAKIIETNVAEIERLQTQIKTELDRSLRVELSYRLRAQQDEKEIEQLRTKRDKLLALLRGLLDAGSRRPEK